MITSVLFDMGGTLEDIWNDAQSRILEIQRIDEILHSHGIDLGVGRSALSESVHAGWRAYAADRDSTGEELKPWRIWCDYVLRDYSIPRERLAPIAEELAHMWEITHYYRVMRPGVPGLLEQLRGLGVKLGVVSNTPSLFQVFDTLEEYGIRDYFQDVTLSSITGFHKPGREIFQVALRQLRARPEECVYVGDTISRDVIGARAAGFARTIQIRSFLTDRSDRALDPGIQADDRIGDIREVGEIVKSLMGQ